MQRTDKIWQHFDEAFEHADRAFAAADKAFEEARNIEPGVYTTVGEEHTVTFQATSRSDRWRLFKKFVGYGFSVLRKGKIELKFRKKKV